MHRIRQVGARSHRLTEEKVQHINSMRSDVVERARSGFGRIDQPAATTLLFVKPCMASEFGKNWFTNNSSVEEVFRALNFGISSPIVSHAERAFTFVCCLHHRTR